MYFGSIGLLDMLAPTFGIPPHSTYSWSVGWAHGPQNATGAQAGDMTCRVADGEGPRRESDKEVGPMSANTEQPRQRTQVWPLHVAAHGSVKQADLRPVVVRSNHRLTRRDMSGLRAAMRVRLTEMAGVGAVRSQRSTRTHAGH